MFFMGAAGGNVTLHKSNAISLPSLSSTRVRVTTTIDGRRIKMNRYLPITIHIRDHLSLFNYCSCHHSIFLSVQEEKEARKEEGRASIFVKYISYNFTKILNTKSS